jgi:hypothetical protein
MVALAGEVHTMERIRLMTLHTALHICFIQAWTQ